MATTKAAAAAIIWKNTPNSVDGRSALLTTQSEDGGYHILRFDCVASEAHEVANTVTSYPVASGFIVSDHVVRLNRQVALDGVVANTIMDGTAKGALLNGLKGLGATAIGQAAGGMGALLAEATYLIDDEEATQDKVREAFRVLTHLVQTGTKVHVSTILGQYTNCVIRKMSATQNASNSSILPAQLVIEEMNVVDVDADKEAARKGVLSNIENGDNLARLLASQGINMAVILAGAL